MQNKLSFFSKFRRVTSSNKYIPEIDGIRFVAILLVVLYHINLNFQARDTGIYKDQQIKEFLEKYLFNGHLGVEIFFVLSGFILSLPFASHYLMNTNKPSLKKFYIKRLTRLEPPYILMLIIMAPLLYAAHRFSATVLVKSFFASLTYTHNFFYPGQVPFINGVAWSLEVEFQFYFLAPFLSYIFIFKKNVRRLVLTASILLLITMQSIFLIQFTSLFLFLQYFLLGFLFADFYITKDYKAINKAVSIPLGILSLLCIMAMPHDEHLNNYQILIYRICLMIFLFIFFYMALFSASWKKILSIPFIATVGGMCYTIYLIHFPIIKIMLQGIGNNMNFTNYFLANYILINICVLFVVLVLSALFYKKIEQPCMKSDWYLVFWKRFGKNIAPNYHSNASK